jgi:HSP20 family protein
VALPGLNPDEIQLSLQGNSLRISGEHKASDEQKESRYLQREFSFERFERTIVLPEDVDTEKVAAEYKHGVLEIVGPLRANAAPKRIEIKNTPKNQPAGANNGELGPVAARAAVSK